MSNRLVMIRRLRGKPKREVTQPTGASERKSDISMPSMSEQPDKTKSRKRLR